MAKSIQISGENDFEKLLKRLSDDIVKAPAFLRIDKRLVECFANYDDEVCQTEFFWAMVFVAVRETGLSRLARVYDKQKDALGLPQCNFHNRAYTSTCAPNSLRFSARRSKPVFPKE
jgi:hypothetical protein